MSIAFGLVMLIITPPFEAPDEPHHFMRAYQISQGQLLPTFRNNKGGDELPESILLISRPFDVSRRQRIRISSARNPANPARSSCPGPPAIF